MVEAEPVNGALGSVRSGIRYAAAWPQTAGYPRVGIAFDLLADGIDVEALEAAERAGSSASGPLACLCNRITPPLPALPEGGPAPPSGARKPEGSGGS